MNHVRARLRTLLSKRTFTSALAVGLIALGVPLLTMGPASAHTPAVSASCSGITVTGTSYESGDTNTLGIQIDGGTWTTKNFSTSGSLTVPVPQDDARVHSWKAYVHTSNSNAAYSKDYSGSVGPCGHKQVTAVLWDKTPPTCSADGALVPRTEPAGITVTRSPATGTGPGHYVITFTAQTGYAITGPTSQTIDVQPRLTGDQCATEVRPVNPTITNPTCTGPGTGTVGSFTLPADGNGITYTKNGDVVTAAADASHKFGTLPSGWISIDAHQRDVHRQLHLAERLPGLPRADDSGEPDRDAVDLHRAGTHSAPVVTLGDVAGDHVSYVYDATSHVVTATPDAGYALGNLPSGWVLQQNRTATYVVMLTDPGACLVQVAVPVTPAPSEPTCSLDGALTVSPSDHVVTRVDGNVVDEATSFGPGEHTVSYSPAAGYTFAQGAVTSVDRTVLPSTQDCPASVSAPRSPSRSAPRPAADGPGGDPGDVAGDHVSYVYDAASHVVTATPDTGFALADLPAGWTPQENGTALYTVVLDPPGPARWSPRRPPRTPRSWRTQAAGGPAQHGRSGPARVAHGARRADVPGRQRPGAAAYRTCRDRALTSPGQLPGRRQPVSVAGRRTRSTEITIATEATMTAPPTSTAWVIGSSSLGLGPAVAFERTRDDERLALERSAVLGGGDDRRFGLHTGVGQVVEDSGSRLVGEVAGEAGFERRSDALDLEESGPGSPGHRLEERAQRGQPVLAGRDVDRQPPGEVDGGRAADLRDAQRR